MEFEQKMDGNYANYEAGLFTQLDKQAKDLKARSGTLCSRFEALPEEVNESEIEGLYRKTLRIMETIEGILSARHNRGECRFLNDYGVAYRKVFSAEYCGQSYFRFQFDSPPLLKTGMALAGFSEKFCLDLLEKTLAATPNCFSKYRAVLVIYINHFNANHKNKAPYYDNDNLAIKQILDVIVPIICVDDASVYCDNLYLSQPDTREFTEIFVVPKEKFSLWLTQNQNLDFCKNALMISEK